MKVKYVGKIYNVFIASIIATMLVSIIITVMSSISYSNESISLISEISAKNDENYYATNIDSGIVSAPNYASVSKFDSQNAALVGANYVSSNIAKFSLADYIPLNTQIKNQGRTNTCWTFSTLSSMQTNLALNDYLNDRPAYNYDFSERHVSLSSIETSSNNSGYNRSPIDGATFWMAMKYYSRAAGPVLEDECPFSEDTSTVPTDSNTYNLNKAATVTDIKMFPAPNSTSYNMQTQINNMKTYIRTKGALCANMYFPINFPDSTYNTAKGASYVNSDSIYQVNHMVSIVGWDDNYSKDNFNSSNKPSSDGAWLIRNSHGKHPYTDNGFLHISYEDKLIYESIFGLEKVDLTKNYTKTLGYDEKGSDYVITVRGGTYTLYNVYERNKNNNINELIDSVSLYLFDDANVSIAIAEGDFNTNKNLTFTSQTIKNSTSVAPGFRTFNLATPYKFNTTSSNAAGLKDKVTVKVTVNSPIDVLTLPLEGGYSKSYVSDSTSLKLRGFAGNTKTETGKCFLGVGNGYVDLGNIHTSVDSSLIDSDSTVQINLVEGTKPSGKLVVKTNPTKTKYDVGENFDATGLSLKYNAGNGSTLNIKLDDCTIKKDKSLTNGQSAVEVYGYGTKINVPITVGDAAEMTPTLTIKTNPTKTNYNVGDNFDSAGMVLKYTHGNASSPTVDEIKASDVTITDGTNLKEIQTFVTAKYNNLTVKIPITVKKKAENPTQPATFDDKENLKNMTVSLDEYKMSTKNSTGFDSFKVTINNIKENSGATYKYYYYVSNTKDGTATKQEAKLVDGKLVLDIDNEKAGSSFKLKDAGDAIYLTIIQANLTANTEVASTVQVDANEHTKLYVDGKYVQEGTTIKGEGTSQGNITAEFNTTEEGETHVTITNPTTVTGDTTIATKKIPQTGTTEEIFKIVIISIALLAGGFIVKSFIINKNMSGK